MKSDLASVQARHMMQSWSAQRDYAPVPVESADGCWIDDSLKLADAEIEERAR